MRTIRVGGSCVDDLRAVAADATPGSRRGKLVAKLNAAEPKRQGGGVVYTLEIEDKYEKALLPWLTEARDRTKNPSAKDALRRIVKSVEADTVSV